jgi:hypothetical protein
LSSVSALDCGCLAGGLFFCCTFHDLDHDTMRVKKYTAILAMLKHPVSFVVWFVICEVTFCQSRKNFFSC